MNQLTKKIFVLSVMAMMVLSGWQTASATTYNEMMKRAHSDEKPAQATQEEENPVLVNYEVGDTSNFYTKRDKAAVPGEESDWEDSDSEGLGRK